MKMGVRAKARLVLRGFGDPDLGDLEKSSPTATRQSKLLLLAYSANEGWILYGGDVRTAFLSGANFDRRIIVKLPTDCGPLLGTGRQHTYMKLLKSAYGLADAPLLWYQEADRRLRRIKWRRHPLDKCFYMLYDREYNLIGALILHVDDLLVGGNDKHEEFIAAIKQLREAFNFGKWRQIQEGKTFVYCGGNLDVDGSGIILNYKDYLKKIVPVTVPKDRNERQALNQWEISKARGLLGALQWPAGQGFPALNASVSILASGIPKGDIGLLNELNKTLRFAKSNCESRIHMKKVFNGLDDIYVVAFSDASYAVRPDGSSQGGFFIFLTSKKVLEGRSVPYNIVSWKSHKLPRVCRSSLAAEAQAGATALDELVLIRSMLSLMLDPDQDPRAESTAQWPGESVLVIDAKALYDNLKKGGGITSAQDKRTGIEIACIADELKRMKTILRWVSSERMYADGLTKIGARQDLIEMLKTGHFQPGLRQGLCGGEEKDQGRARKVPTRKRWHVWFSHCPDHCQCTGHADGGRSRCPRHSAKHQRWHVFPGLRHRQPLHSLPHLHHSPHRLQPLPIDYLAVAISCDTSSTDSDKRWCSNYGTSSRSQALPS